MNSGIRPNLRRSSGSTSLSTASESRSLAMRMSALNPTPFFPMRLSMIFSMPGERAAADEEDVRGVDLDELLVRVLAAALGRHRGRGALEDLQQRLLHTLARDVTRDRRVLALAGDLVDLVDVDDAGLGLLHVVVGRLDELEEDVLDVLTHVAGFGERSRVGDRERHVEHASERLREERLAAAGRADEQDVRLRQLDVVVVGRAELHPLVVVVDGDREDLLRRAPARSRSRSGTRRSHEAWGDRRTSAQRSRTAPLR